jgi:hypothetical protein
VTTTSAAPAATPGTPPEPGAEEEFIPVYGTVEEWVIEIFTTHFPRSGGRWCAQWWEHPEAILTLNALWQTWEQARPDGGPGIADWVTRYLYPILRELVSNDGPFATCTDARHADTPIWPYVPAPEGYWP